MKTAMSEKGRHTDLRARGDVRSRKADIWCPGDVSDPVGMLVDDVLNDPVLVLLSNSTHDQPMSHSQSAYDAF
jgi:hypothetical protein